MPDERSRVQRQRARRAWWPAVSGQRATDHLLPTGLVFTRRSESGPRSPGIGPDSVVVLPRPLRDWLASAALPLLMASGTPPPEEDGGPAVAAEDPAVAAALMLAALKTARARTTNRRLYKKDAEKVQALTGASAAEVDDLLGTFTAEHLVRLSRALGDPVRIRWPAVERWARIPAAARAAAELARRHSGTLPWLTLLAAGGSWVEEVHLARRSRLITSPVYVRSRPNPIVRRDIWARLRATIERWPEVDVREHGGHTFFRLRPALASALRARPATSTDGAKLFVQPDFEVLVPREAGLASMLLLARVAQLVRADVVATFKLTPDSIRGAVIGGLALDRILADLRALSAHGVPPAVERALHDWTGQAGRCTVHEVLLVRFDDQSIAARAAAALGTAADPLGPTALAVRADSPRQAAELLTQAGFPPRGAAADGEEEDWLGGFGDGDADADGGDEEVLASVGPDPHEAGARGRSGQAPELAHPEHAGSIPLAETLDVPLVALSTSEAELDQALLATLRAARAGGSAPAPRGGVAATKPARGSTSGAGPAPTRAAAARGAAAKTPDAIMKAFRRAAHADADVVVILRDGNDQVLRAAPALEALRDGVVRAIDPSTGALRELSLQTIAALIPLFATSRAVSRNQPCPCGSSRKFKRCCLAEGAGFQGGLDA